ncbi:hypothetical protein [Nocardioides sp.]|uniref:hypothetical protein n=1 Tax=Nocardioides sp. TaxID=35761 RepID=UPI003561B200
MPDLSNVTRDDVMAALAEYDKLGGDEFLSRYGFGPSREYVLLHGERSYDSKAILGVAHRYATGAALSSQDFSGGRSGAAKVLRALGFEVSGPDEIP